MQVVRMVCHEAILHHLSIGEFQVKISYAGEQTQTSLKPSKGHVSDSDSHTAKQKQPLRRPQLHPKPNTSNPRNKENATSPETS